jgi:hypothetical protein
MKRKKREKKHYDKKKTKLPTSPTELQIFQRPSSQTTTSEASHMTSKGTPTRRKRRRSRRHTPNNRRKVFTWKTKIKQEASQQNASKEDHDTRRCCRCWHRHHSWEGFRLKLRQILTWWRRKGWITTLAATIRNARRERLGSPQPNQRPTTRESRHLPNSP